ncbi:MAG: DUF2723 domain-containing protein [Muribaculaceae bacterium]|nr:DUF2723 domain-containing protein [Muribaculaceae bacterium]
MLTKKYTFINNIGGWLVFCIALATYWLTLEPTASYWDCGEFIIQADKLEVGHPPGNPIFMLTARFFSNFATDAGSISVMVNAMSGLLSALTILLLFWTITHLVRRLVVKDGQRKEITLQQYIAIMGSGLVGSLAYCWSDTFWFSAVEGEVYAFSSFCTALVFWLILKWEDNADKPHSDRYLILIAYIIGVSVAVHLLNLLCIPAIVLVFAYRKWPDMTLVKSLVTLGVSFVIVALVLFGLVPGFIKVAQQFELLFVNGFHLSYNSGAIFYGLLTAGIFIWTLSELYRQKNGVMIRVSFFLSLAISGIFFFGDTFVIGWFILAFVAFLLFSKYGRNLSVRVLNVIMWSIAVIFVGYSSYALILIRSSADTPMNQNSPDNVFDLASYLNREQYGENPLIYGETLNSSPMKEIAYVARDTVGYREDGTAVILSTPYYNSVIEKGKVLYGKGVAGATPSSDYGHLSQEEVNKNKELAARGGDYYVKKDYKPETKLNPELNMFLPRIWDRMHRDSYSNWVSLDTTASNMVQIFAVDPATGERIPEYDTQKEPVYNQYTGRYAYPEKYVYKPTFAQNLAYFFNYQLNHMYLRYFMWNFAGRQNDINNQMGELDAGNWISGIPVIDNVRLGDQSLLPDDLGKNNAGHNKYFMLPLVLGIIGLIWQSFAGKRGIEQFWIVFFLFFMTGIAIVLYLNQTPDQPRERDYAFAGSFYAYAIWIGMGVAAIWRILMWGAGSVWVKGKTKVSANPGFPVTTQEGRQLQEKINKLEKINPQRDLSEPVQLSGIVEEPQEMWKNSVLCAAIAFLIGIIIPIQMVSQTWDDHDRSGRYAARDFAINYLESLEPNAIVFCNGDNDTFPLWYVQEVEGVRPDVRIINLSYLNSDWYASQMLKKAYDSEPVKITATPADYAYGKADVTLLPRETAPADLLSSLKLVYQGNGKDTYGYPTLPSAVVTIPIDKKAVMERGLVSPKDTADIVDQITINLRNTSFYGKRGYLSLGDILMLDIIATNAAEGWPRPIYWVTTVGNDYHLGFTPYLRSTGMAHQLVPTIQEGLPARTDRAYDVVTNYKWGGADFTEGKAPYFDETARRMLLTTRSTMLDVINELIYDGDRSQNPEEKQDYYKKALEVADLVSTKLDERTGPFGISLGSSLAEAYYELGTADRLDDKKLTDRGLEMMWKLLEKYATYLKYNQMVAHNFRNPSLTMESRLIPYQYYYYATLYERMGGDMQKLEDLLGRYGFTLAELEHNYNLLYKEGYSTESDQSRTEAYAQELAQYCEIVNELAKLKPEEYAQRSDDERQVDSLLSVALEYYQGLDPDFEILGKYDSYKQLDKQRTIRLGEEYALRHPSRN